MSRSVRRAGALLLVAMLVTLALTGCVAKVPPLPPEDPVPPEPPPVDAGDSLAPFRHGPLEEYPVKQVLSPMSPRYLAENNLEMLRSTVGNTRELHISGLKDIAVQEKINANLAAMYETIRTGGIPPYRGVRTLIPEGSTLRTVDFEAAVTFNHNDVLSIVVRYYKEYLTESTRRAPVIQGIETRNFDLTTGNEIPLSYVFCDDVDYLSLLSDAMQRRHGGLKAAEESYNMYDWGVPVLVAPFRGVRADQVYYLSPGELCLVLDHRTPEFELSLNVMDVPFSFRALQGSIAIGERFYDAAADLYVNQGQRTLSLSIGYSRGETALSETAEHLGETYAYMVTYTIPRGAAPEVSSFIMDEFASYRAIVDSFSERGAGYWTLSKQIYVRYAGPYATVYLTENVNKLDRPVTSIQELQWLLHAGDQSYSLRNAYYCFSPDGDLLALGDLFVPGFDYVSLIRDNYDRVTAYGHIKRPPYDEIAGEIIFSLEATELVLRTPYLPTLDGYQQFIQFNIPYKGIGYENLTIFD